MGRSSQTLQLQTLRRLPNYRNVSLHMFNPAGGGGDRPHPRPDCLPPPPTALHQLPETWSAGGIKQELFSPLIGIKRNLIDAKRGIVAPFLNLKTGLVKTKLGLVSGIVGAKANIARGVLRPVFGIKRGK